MHLACCLSSAGTRTSRSAVLRAASQRASVADSAAAAATAHRAASIAARSW